MNHVAIIGMGTMGSAIAKSLSGRYTITGLDQGDDLSRITEARIVIVAVKPQSFAELSQSLKPYIKEQTVLSIMAGISSSRIVERLGTSRVARTMPNLSLAQAKSLTAVYAEDPSAQQDINDLLLLWGEVVWLQQEADFDVFTALAGSGPAYLFEMVAQLQHSAEQLGFDKKLAQQIANSVLGSAAVMLEGASAAEKVRQIASKGGTTEAALKVFAEHKFEALILEAVKTAAQRSKELSNELR